MLPGKIAQSVTMCAVVKLTFTPHLVTAPPLRVCAANMQPLRASKLLVISLLGCLHPCIACLTEVCTRVLSHTVYFWCR